MEVSVARVVRVYSHRCIPQNSFWAGSGHHHLSLREHSDGLSTSHIISRGWGGYV